ncbi:exonuclease DPD1, chloroplastic/mitochondrial isoform X3 [Corylus avellana]|nr:exonuclease DPD1, chloroplastic/mitochondrial isoform X3 [Corylus avellana]
MRTVSTCFSILQVPRCRIPTLANSWRESFHSLSRSDGNSSSFKLLSSKIYGLDRGHNKKWTRRPVTTNAEGRNKTTQHSKPSNIRREILDGVVSKSATINVNKKEISQFQKNQYCDIQQKISENKDLAGLVTVMVFDLETTGFSREYARIIEIAVQDLLGGRNSTFETLVNPQCDVPNSHIHGITSSMVNKPGVPRMEDLIPLLLQYVRSREKPDGYVLWVAHNARTFDVPFLIKEFSRCSTEVPPNWLFVDTRPLAREVMKSKGSKNSRISLEALREYYEIPLVGSAHRAMSDVALLSMILQRLTFDLKLPVSGLVERSFSASDWSNSKKKN